MAPNPRWHWSGTHAKPNMIGLGKLAKSKILGLHSAPSLRWCGSARISNPIRLNLAVSQVQGACTAKPKIAQVWHTCQIEGVWTWQSVQSKIITKALGLGSASSPRQRGSGTQTRHNTLRFGNQPSPRQHVSCTHAISNALGIGNELSLR